MHTNTYQHILLDWDGNLAKTLDIWLEAIREALRHRGFHLTDQQIAHTFGDPINKFRDLGVADPEAAIWEADAIAKRTLPSVELYPDALELLHYLREHHKQTALLTASLHENVDHILERYNIRDSFDVIIAGEDVTHHKPHPESIEKALAALGGAKSQAVIIGDSDKDLGAATNAGIDSILFYPPEHAKFYDLATLKALGPTYIVERLADVKDIIT